MTLDERVAFDSPTVSADGYGGSIAGWTAEFEARAAFRYLRGGETVQAARLAGRQPVVVTLRASADARRIEPDWRMRDVRSGTVYQVRTAIPSEDRRHVELTCESGVAV